MSRKLTLKILQQGGKLGSDGMRSFQWYQQSAALIILSLPGPWQQPENATFMPQQIDLNNAKPLFGPAAECM